MVALTDIQYIGVSDEQMGQAIARHVNIISA